MTARRRFRSTRWEHAVLGLAGDVVVQGAAVDRSELVYLGTGRSSLQVSGRGGALVLLIGGEPFGEEILMWWNFVGRTHEDVERWRAQWQVADPQFGEVVGFDGDRLPAPELPALRLRPRGHR